MKKEIKYQLNYFGGELFHTSGGRFDVTCSDIIEMAFERCLEVNDSKIFNTYEEAIEKAKEFKPSAWWTRSTCFNILEADFLEIEKIWLEDDEIIESEIIKTISEGCFVDPYEDMELFSKNGIKVYTEYGFVYFEDGINTIELKNTPDNQDKLMVKAHRLTRHR